MLGDAMSIFARRQSVPSANSPAFMRRKSARLSAGGRSRHGLGRPGEVGTPRYSFHCSWLSSQT